MCTKYDREVLERRFLIKLNNKRSILHKERISNLSFSLITAYGACTERFGLRAIAVLGILWNTIRIHKNTFIAWEEARIGPATTKYVRGLARFIALADFPNVKVS